MNYNLYVNNLLVKEDFRIFAKQKQIAKYCVIDLDHYCYTSEIAGCISIKGYWIVYQTTRNAEFINIIKYKNAKDAFKDLSSRFGMDFQPQKNYSEEFINQASESICKVAKDLEGTSSGEIARRDFEIIQIILKLNSKNISTVNSVVRKCISFVEVGTRKFLTKSIFTNNSIKNILISQPVTSVKTVKSIPIMVTSKKGKTNCSIPLRRTGLSDKKRRDKN